MELDQWEWDHEQEVAEVSACPEPGSYLGQTGTAEEQVTAVFRGDAVAAEAGIILLRFGNRQLLSIPGLVEQSLSRKPGF